ncbi:hypothetical protein OG520_14535 [Streptomyces sp. NBC_00984]|uniref:hypothetical protein n=1 Tax=Streptomyces sp. NBC_00984 TaxID=2903700 RepID=UPI00386BC51E|nr:hypothetical protein OG520_14535 [Streptomyces sp. NBC_00984]
MASRGAIVRPSGPTAAGRAEEGVESLRAVCTDLHRDRPDGLRYDTLRLDGGADSLALVESEGGPVAASHHRQASFQRYRAALSEICTEPPAVIHLDEVGSCRPE